MSSNVHLTTLSLLRDWLWRNRVLRTSRLVAMTFLLLLLVCALVPTATVDWVHAIHGITLNGHNPKSQNPRNGFGIPAYCFWKHRSDAEVSVNALFSFLLLAVSYVWKFCQLSNRGRFIIRKWLRCVPQWLLERLAVRMLKTREQHSTSNSALFRMVALVYVPLVAVFEFLESFMATLWLLIFGLLWGTFQVIATREHVGPDVTSRESSWSFGQLIPLLFLLQPAIAMLGISFGEADPTFKFFKKLTQRQRKEMAHPLPALMRRMTPKTASMNMIGQQRRGSIPILGRRRIEHCPKFFWLQTWLSHQ